MSARTSGHGRIGGTLHIVNGHRAEGCFEEVRGNLNAGHGHADVVESPHRNSRSHTSSLLTFDSFNLLGPGLGFWFVSSLIHFSIAIESGNSLATAVQSLSSLANSINGRWIGSSRQSAFRKVW